MEFARRHAQTNGRETSGNATEAASASVRALRHALLAADERSRSIPAGRAPACPSLLRTFVDGFVHGSLLTLVVCSPRRNQTLAVPQGTHSVRTPGRVRIQRLERELQPLAAPTLETFTR